MTNNWAMCPIERIYYENRVIQLCSDYASVSHIGQIRKDKVTPYISHPARVAFLVGQSKYVSFIEVCAAWLHDVLEDCSEIVNDEYSHNINNHTGKNKDIRTFLHVNNEIISSDGRRILELVKALTTSQNKTISKDKRKKDSYKNIISIHNASLIKYCDRIDNLMTVDNFSDSGKKYYLEDTENMISHLDEFVYDDFIQWELYKILNLIKKE